MKAKADGNKEVANALKLVLNTTYGAMLNQYNPLYDPLMGRSVCISGQLFLTDLVMGYIYSVQDLEIINFNTDGIMIRLREEDLPKIEAVNSEWEKRVGFQLEEDRIKKIVQKDVNNYIVKYENGKIKTKGAYVTYGESKAGAWSINNSATIIKKAIVDYFIHGTPPEKTIDDCNDVKEFQYISKGSSLYSKVYQ